MWTSYPHMEFISSPQKNTGWDRFWKEGGVKQNCCLAHTGYQSNVMWYILSLTGPQQDFAEQLICWATFSAEHHYEVGLVLTQSFTNFAKQIYLLSEVPLRISQTLINTTKLIFAKQQIFCAKQIHMELGPSHLHGGDNSCGNLLRPIHTTSHFSWKHFFSAEKNFFYENQICEIGHLIFFAENADQRFHILHPKNTIITFHLVAPTHYSFDKTFPHSPIVFLVPLWTWGSLSWRSIIL